MESFVARNLGKKFLSALGRLSEITQVKREAQPMVHYLNSPEDIPPDAEPESYRAVIERAKKTLEYCQNMEIPPLHIGPAYCSIRTFVKTPRTDRIATHHARAAAGEWLSFLWADSFDTMHYSIRQNCNEPFDTIDIEDLLSLPEKIPGNEKSREQAFDSQIQKIWANTAFPASQFAKNYIRSYCMTIMVIDAEEWEPGDQKTGNLCEMNRLEKIIDLVENLGSFSAWERGRAEFGKMLRVRQDEFHEYLNQVYREAIEKSSREDEQEPKAF